VWGLILWAIIFHRKRTDRPPYQVRYNLPIEMLYTVVPFIMIGVLFYFTARDENYINKLSAKPRRGGQRGRLPVELAVPVPAVPGAGVGDPPCDGQRAAVDAGERAPAAAAAGDSDQ
jgi:heme/copper-type cytochrome/quinol oxidase subunit 2